MTTTTIQHIIVMPSNLKETNFTFFQGFSREVAVDYGKILSWLSWVPHDILEARLGFESLIASKMMGSSLNVSHVNENLLDDNHVDFSSYFTFVWSTEGTVEKASEACKKFEIIPIHISCEKYKNVIHIDDLNERIIAEAIDNIRNLVIQNKPNVELSKHLSSQKIEERERIQFPFAPLNHSCITPSAKALVACGYEVGEVEEIEPSAVIDQHSKGIVKINSLIDEIRAGYNFPAEAMKNDGIIFCPSIYTHLYKIQSKMWKDLYRILPKVKRDFIKDALVRNKGFSNFELRVDDGDEFNPYEDPFLRTLFTDRQLELFLFREIVSILASNQFCSAIRLPNGVMLHHDRLNNIASLIKSPSLSKEKNLLSLNKKFKSYSDAVRKDVGEELFKVAFEGRKKYFLSVIFQ